MVQVHNFDWDVYSENIMPAFEHWLVKGNEGPIQNLFTNTRCSLEEQFLPSLIRKLSIWPRANAFITSLPRGPHSLREYRQICSARQFTNLSDRYLHHHAPRLYQESDALRTIWGALVEEYCISWYPSGTQEGFTPDQTSDDPPQKEAIQSELIQLLQTAGLDAIVRQIHQPGIQVERIEWESNTYNFLIGELAEEIPNEEPFTNDLIVDDEGDLPPARQAKEGINIGTQTDLLQLRGWLAGISLRVLVLFELLAFGRRRMPFGYNFGEPFGCYIGYLTPEEVSLLEQGLQNVTPPDPKRARRAHQKFRESESSHLKPYRFVDEILPAYAGEFLNVIRIAAYQKRGLICETD
jgi:hypothetical protein